MVNACSRILYNIKLDFAGEPIAVSIRSILFFLIILVLYEVLNNEVTTVATSNMLEEQFKRSY